MPKLKPATINAKINTLKTELSELQHQRRELVDSASSSPLIGQYIATKQSGGTAFSRKSEKQAAHDYYALVDATGAFIRYVGKQEVAAYRDRIQLGKKISKLDRAISRCAKRISEYESKLPPAKRTQSPTVSVSNSLPKAQDNSSDQSETEVSENDLYAVDSQTWIVSEAA